MTDKLLRLEREAIEAAKFRGHDMGVFRFLGKQSRETICKGCGARVTVDAKPARNGIEIGGPAVCGNQLSWWNL
jgi:hypothetical protein